MTATDAYRSYYYLVPIGVVYVIVPFNWPLIICFRGLIPQLALGNAVYVRFADSTPQLGLLL